MTQTSDNLLNDLFSVLLLPENVSEMDIKNTCFVCKKTITKDTSYLNLMVNMPVCNACRDSEQEKKAEREVLDSLADGFVCGCI